MITRVCSRCKAENPLEEFCKNTKRKEGRSNTCRSCGRESTRRWRENHKEECNAIDRVYRRKLKETILLHYGNGKLACVNCGYNNLKALSVDHIEGQGKAHRDKLGYNHGIGFYLWLKREGFPEGYQTLCMNCQWEKRE